MRAFVGIAIMLLAGCGKAAAPPPPADAGITAKEALDAYAEFERSVAAQRTEEWRRCAAFVRAEDGAERGRADAARGVRTFLTHFEGGLAVAEIAPGISDCTPRANPQHQRYPTISGCGDVVGDGHSEDCACEAAEMAYKAAYNRAILAADANARAGNCQG